MLAKGGRWNSWALESMIVEIWVGEEGDLGRKGGGGEMGDVVKKMRGMLRIILGSTKTRSRIATCSSSFSNLLLASNGKELREA